MNRIIRIFKYEFYVKELLIIFFTFLMMENIFSWLVLPNSVILLAYEKIMSLAIFAFVLYKFKNLKIVEKSYVVLFVLVMVRLIIESVYKYGNFFEQLTMFSVLFPVIFVIFIKCICRSLQLDFLPFLAQFYLYLYIVFMLVYGRGFSFSLDSVDMIDYGPFSGDSRIIHARSIFMMIVPFLYYLNRFLQTNKVKYFIPFAFCFVVILIHQHRSVWASCITAAIIYIFASFRNRYIPIIKLFKMLIIATVFLIASWFVVDNVAPKFTNFMGDRFSEILNPTKEDGTGEFRQEQREVYFELFLKRPVFGWTFEGFDMPNPLVDWWPPKSGQHFHEGYMEMLFYLGIVGLLLKYSFLFYFIYKVFSKNLSQDSIILVSFCLSGLVFSFSYVLPLVFWGVTGVCLYYIEKKPDVEEEDDGIEYEEVEEEDSAIYQFLNNSKKDKILT
jgi:hypothetical protein